MADFFFFLVPFPTQLYPTWHVSLPHESFPFGMQDSTTHVSQPPLFPASPSVLCCIIYILGILKMLWNDRKCDQNWIVVTCVAEQNLKGGNLWRGKKKDTQQKRIFPVGLSAVFSFCCYCDCNYFSQVLVTVPLALLQKNAIQFNPPLSEKKIKAINSLGAGVIEKVRKLGICFSFFSQKHWLLWPCCFCCAFLSVHLHIWFYLYSLAKNLWWCICYMQFWRGWDRERKHGKKHFVELLLFSISLLFEKFSRNSCVHFFFNLHTVHC